MTHMFWPAHESGHFWQPHLPQPSHSGPAYHICPFKNTPCPLPLFPGFQHPSGPATTKIGGSSATIAKISAQGPHEAPCATGVPCRVILAQKFTPHRGLVAPESGLFLGSSRAPKTTCPKRPPEGTRARITAPECAGTSYATPVWMFCTLIPSFRSTRGQIGPYFASIGVCGH